MLPFLFGLPCLYYYYAIQAPNIKDRAPRSAGSHAVEARVPWKKEKTRQPHSTHSTDTAL